MQSTDYYRTDSIFYHYGPEVWSLLYDFPKKHGVIPYIIDRMPVDNWINNGCKPCITNSLILTPLVNSKFIVQTKNSFYGIYYCPYNLEASAPNKEFNCFINRMDPIRQSWLYQLIRRKFFNQGYISFNMDIARLPNYKKLTPHEVFEKQFQEQCNIFKEEHKWISTRVPYRNFHSGGDLTDVIVDSKFSIVLETYFDNNDVQTYSEKTFRVLQLPRPWILFAHKGAVKYLEKLGFDVLYDIVDHEFYDNIDCPIERQVKLLDLTEKLINSEVDYFRARQAAAHNQQILKNFNQTCKQDYIDQILYAKSLI